MPAVAQPLDAVWSDARVQARAAQRSPAVLQARAELDRARATRVEGQRAPIGNPTLGLIALPGAPDFGAWTAAVSLGLPIEVSGARGAYSREAARGVLAARERLDDATTRAVAAARQARVDLAVARAMVGVQRARLETALEAERRVRARADAGAATAVEVSLAERERGVAEADVASAEARVTEALAAFRSALDLPPREAADVGVVAAPTRVSDDELATAIARAPGARRDVAALEHDAARFDLGDSRAARAAVAPLVLGFEAQQVAVSPQDLGASVGASARWELPLVQRAQGERAVLRADASASRGAAALLRAQVARDVSRSAEALSRALDELDALEGRAIPAATRLVRATESAFAAGALDYFRVLVAQGELLQLRARALDALRAAWAARLSFERALGGGNDE